MRKGDESAIVWELTISLHSAVTEGSMRALRERIRTLAEADPATPFLWHSRGALVTVRTEGEPDSLADLAKWALTNMIPLLNGFELARHQMAPLVRLGDWQGHGRA